MKSFSNLTDNEKKQNYKSEVLITLESGIQIQGYMNIRDYNKNYAFESCQHMFKDEYNIKDIEILNVQEDVDNDEEKQKETQDDGRYVEFYVPDLMWFYNHDGYNPEQIKEALDETDEVSNIYTEEKWGWANNPEVVIFSLKLTDNQEENKQKINQIEEILNNHFQTDEITVVMKNWREEDNKKED